jgi:hypothetical protein
MWVCNVVLWEPYRGSWGHFIFGHIFSTWLLYLLKSVRKVLEWFSTKLVLPKWKSLISAQPSEVILELCLIFSRIKGRKVSRAVYFNWEYKTIKTIKFGAQKNHCCSPNVLNCFPHQHTFVNFNQHTIPLFLVSYL